MTTLPLVAAKALPWTPHVYQCARCAELLCSKWPGYFSLCGCESYSFVDETLYYIRVGGDAVPLGSTL